LGRVLFRLVCPKVDGLAQRHTNKHMSAARPTLAGASINFSFNVSSVNSGSGVLGCAIVSDLRQ
jgi:hypothetical protein